jgi:hypothetical protein
MDDNKIFIKTERNYPLIIELDKNKKEVEVNEIIDYLEKNFGYNKNSIQLKNKEENKNLNNNNNQILNENKDLLFRNLINKKKNNTN